MRPELSNPGVYSSLGRTPTRVNRLRTLVKPKLSADRLKQHKGKEFWSSAIAFVSKDENLTKAHVRYLEGRLLAEAVVVGRYKVTNSVSSGAKLPESDLQDMEVFLERIAQLLPVLGTDLLARVAPTPRAVAPVQLVVLLR